MGRDLDNSDISSRFDLETGEGYLRRHFSTVERRRWPGEMVLSNLQDVMTLWPKWQPGSLDEAETKRVRAAFQEIASARLERDGSLKIRRRDGAFVCDL